MMAVIDGTTGDVYINPDEETLALMKKKQKEEELRLTALEQVRGVPTVTKDGKKINLFANIGNPGNLPQVLPMMPKHRSFPQRIPLFGKQQLSDGRSAVRSL